MIEIPDGIRVTGDATPNPIPSISVSNDDLRRDWFANAKTAYIIDLDEIDIVPKDHHAAVKFYPDLNAIAQYYVGPNEIRVGKKALGMSEGIYTAFLRHESAHAHFANLSNDDQLEIVNLFRKYHADDLRKFYLALRTNDSYKAEYYDADFRVKYLDYYRKLGRGYWVCDPMMIWEGENLANVDIVPVINELIAYRVTTEGGGEYLEEATGKEGRFDLAKEIFTRLNPDLRAILDRLGFFNIEGEKLLDELKKDQAFLDAQVAAKITIEGEI